MAKVRLVQQLPAGIQRSLNQDANARVRRNQNLQVAGAGVPGGAEPTTERASELISAPGREYPDERVPTLITTQKHFVSSATVTGNVISCWVNPATVGWTLPRREALQKVRAGGIRYSWRKRARGSGAGRRKRNNTRHSTVFDEFSLAFTFQTGNIFTHPLGSNKGDIPPGVDDFYTFLRLLNEEKILSDGRENWHIVVHTSPLFPQITFKGWFTPEGVSFSESADSGFGIQWTSTMEVHESTPKIYDDAGLRRVFGVIRR